MVPVLLILNGIIWYGVYRGYKDDKARGPYIENPSFDQDMDRLGNWKSSFKSRDKAEDISIKQDFEKWLEHETRKDKTLEEYLWQEGILNPDEVVWCEGEPLVPFDPKDMVRFLQIRKNAIDRGIYNGINLDEGGRQELNVAWLMLKGCSRYGAIQLLEMGVKPQDFNYEL